jgi:sterol 24-C-methyltransferase
VIPSKWNARLQRFSTILRSFKIIYQLSPQQVDNFIKAYEIYECDWVSGQAIRNSKTIEYDEISKNILNWYSVLNHMCSLGFVEKMYIPPTLDLSANIIKNQLLYERQFSKWLDMKANDQVLELGCGRGRITAHLAAITGAHITGINIDQSQLESAEQFAKKNNLLQQCRFMKVDFNHLPLPFPDNHFDCVYEVQALSLSRDLEKLFRELCRVIKPGGKLGICSEWIRLPKYNPDNPHHRELMRRAKIQAGAIGSPSSQEYEMALNRAGFTVLLSQDPSLRKSQPLVHQAGHSFERFLPMLRFLVKINMFPKHFITLFDYLGKNTAALLEAENLDLLSMSYHLTAQKPYLHP